MIGNRFGIDGCGCRARFCLKLDSIETIPDRFFFGVQGRGRPSFSGNAFGRIMGTSFSCFPFWPPPQAPLSAVNKYVINFNFHI